VVLPSAGAAGAASEADASFVSSAFANLDTPQSAG
jgi:hypothetical protein